MSCLSRRKSQRDTSCSPQKSSANEQKEVIKPGDGLVLLPKVFEGFMKSSRFVTELHQKRRSVVRSTILRKCNLLDFAQKEWVLET